MWAVVNGVNVEIWPGLTLDSHSASSRVFKHVSGDFSALALQERRILAKLSFPEQTERQRSDRVGFSMGCSH